MNLNISQLLTSAYLIYFLVLFGINLVNWIIYKIFTRFSDFFTSFKAAYVFLSLYLSLRLPLMFLEISNQENLTAFAGAFIVAALIFFLFKLLDIFVFDFILGEKKHLYLPPLLHNIILWLVYLIATLSLLKALFNVNLTPILATSAVFSMVIGLALQNILVNLFSGIILSVEQPFKIGDWVEINGRRGQVVQIDWRTTKLKNGLNDLVVIPNGGISQAEIINFYKPTRLHMEKINIGVSYRNPPSRVKDALLEIVGQIKGVRRRPAPEVFMTDFNDSSINYELRIWLDDYKDRLKINNDINTLIWYQFRRKDIEIPFPIQDVNLHTVSQIPEEEKQAALVKEITPTLLSVPILKPLSQKEITRLAGKVGYHTFAGNEIIFQENEPGDSFFIVKNGAVEICKEGSNNELLPIVQLKEGDYFGEMSLLTGERRTATVRALADTELIVIGKTVFQEILTSNPSIVEKLSYVLYDRQQETREKMLRIKEILNQAPPKIESHSSLLKSIRRFFGI